MIALTKIPLPTNVTPSSFSESLLVHVKVQKDEVGQAIAMLSTFKSERYVLL